MTDLPVNLTPGGPPDTVLPPADPVAVAALGAALAADATQRKPAIAAVVADWPRFLDAWARLGEATTDAVESYAYFRVGYHRGLDTLRAAGWRGSGYVRWDQPSNRGFLRTLRGLRLAAARVGEDDEVDRIGQFLGQLDPDSPLDPIEAGSE